MNAFFGGTRIIVPKTLRKQILELLHEGHIGIVKMKHLARNLVYWPRIDLEIEEITKTCEQCQLQGNLQPKIDYHPWYIPRKPWQRLHLDFAKKFYGSNFLFIVDATSKWLDVVKIPKLTSEETIKILKTCFATHGLPCHTGAAFTGQEFTLFCRRNGIKHTTNGAYHPQTNGLAERGVQLFKKQLRKWMGN